VDLNVENLPAGDIVLGRLDCPANRSEVLDSTSDSPNTVQVTVPLLTDGINGPASTFFSRIWGINTSEMMATASATVWYPALLPFGTSEDNWESLSEGGAGDMFRYGSGTGGFPVEPGPDDEFKPEIVLFPGNWNGQEALPPGNFGIIEIGPGGSELTNLRRQVDRGPSVPDIEFHGGSLNRGQWMYGRTGIKSSTKHAFLGGQADARLFAGILGRVRQIPLYDAATGNGSNAEFRLARFVTARVMALQIDGRWRTDYMDTDGEEITALRVQAVDDLQDLIQVQLTR
jgi:hypothetical protein